MAHHYQDFFMSYDFPEDKLKKKKTSETKKKKIPQYYKGCVMIKKNKPYAYGGRIAKYKD